jgi:hypothetical protein
MSASSIWRRLVADPRSVRAIEETLLDIRLERTNADGVWLRALWWARAVAALTRAGVAVSRFEVRAVAPGAWALRLLLWTVPPVAVAAYGPIRSHLATDLPVWVPFLLLPQSLVVVLPFSFFWTALWPPPAATRSVLVPTLAAVLLAGSVVLATPAANQLFRTTVFEGRGGQGRVMRGLAEMSIPELMRAAVSDRDPSGTTAYQARARQQIALLTGLVVLAGALTVLASRLATRVRHRWPWAIGVPLAVYPAFGVAGQGGAVWAVLLTTLIALSWLAQLEKAHDG